MTDASMRLYGGVALPLSSPAGPGFGTVGLSAPAPTKTDATTTPDAPESPKTAITLTADGVTAAGIEVQAVGLGGLGSEILAPADVVPAPDGQAVLTARATGAITRITKRLGDPVRAGETVAVIESREAATIAADRS